MEEIEDIKKELPGETVEDHIHAAKTYLMRSATNESGFTVYDHLVELLAGLLESRPTNPVSILDDLSRKNKKAKFSLPRDTIQDVQVAPTESTLAHEQKQLFERKGVIPDSVPEVEEGQEEPVQDQPLQDVMETMFYFEQAGVGLGREEQFRIFLALKQLTDTYSLKSCRFWGKMLGLDANYVVAEVEFNDGEDPDPNFGMEEEAAGEEVVPDTAATPGREGAGSSASLHSAESPQKEVVDEDVLPKSNFKPAPVIPPEMMGTGCNKKVYFACNDAGLSWSRLPPVTPAQLQVARQIRKFFTGRLDEKVISYPPFPGSEANYLRAQIARITAGTQVSPQGYYVFEEDEDDEDAVRDTVEVNLEFEGIPVAELCDPSLSNWVHHNMYILPQGRTTWFNPLKKDEEEEGENEEEDEEEEKEEPDEMEPEEGPPLLSPLSEDQEVNGQAAWTPVKSTSLLSQFAIAVLHSNLWPGAHVYALNKKFENIYIGHGLKYNHDNYNPPVPPPCMEEYPSGPEITEHDDPSVEQEKALKAAQQEADEDEEEEQESEDEDDD